MYCIHGVPTNLRLPLMEPSAREDYIFWTWFEGEERGGGE